MTRQSGRIGDVALAAGLALAFSAASPLTAQEQWWGTPPSTASVYGTVIDARSGTPLAGAAVGVAGSAEAVLTNSEGRFVLEELPPGKQMVMVEQLGYRIWQGAITASNPGAPVLLRMVPDPIMLKGLEVSADRFADRMRLAYVKARAVGTDDFAAYPAATLADVLAAEAGLFLTMCSGTILVAPPRACNSKEHEHGWAVQPSSPHDNRCVRRRGGRLRPTVYLDEAPLIGGLARLENFPLDRLYRVEVWDGFHIRAFTKNFMRRLQGVSLGPLPVFH